MSDVVDEDRALAGAADNDDDDEEEVGFDSGREGYDLQDDDDDETRDDDDDDGSEAEEPAYSGTAAVAAASSSDDSDDDDMRSTDGNSLPPGYEHCTIKELREGLQDDYIAELRARGELPDEKTHHKFETILTENLLIILNEDTTTGENEKFVIENLKKYPRLAWEPYDYAGKEWFPIVHLLVAGTDAEVLVEILDLTHPYFVFHASDIPEALKGLLSLACFHRGDETELIRILTERFPFLLKDRTPSVERSELVGVPENLDFDPHGLLPIHIAIGQRAPRETLQVLLERYPQSVLEVGEHPRGMDCFTMAVAAACAEYSDENTGYSKEVIDMILKAIQKEITAPRRLGTDCYYTIYDHAASLLGKDSTEKNYPDAMSRLLDTLDCVKFVCTEGDSHRPHKGWGQFLTAMASNKSIRVMKIVCDVPSFENNKYFDSDQLGGCFQQNNHLKELTCEFSDHPMESNPLLEKLLNQGLANNKSIQKLNLSYLVVPHISKLIEDLLAGPLPCVEHLFILNCHIEAGEDAPELTAAQMEMRLSTSKLKKVTLMDNRMSRGAFKQWIIACARLPMLEHWDASYSKLPAREECDATNEIVDLTEPLVDLLARNKLQHLSTTWEVNLNESTICKALQKNTSLQYLGTGSLWNGNSIDDLLDLVKNHNTTLHTVGGLDGTRLSKEEETIFWLDLNKYGRGKVSEGQLSLETFLKLLCPDGLKGVRLFNLQFYFLLQCPVLWSSSSNSGCVTVPPEPRSIRKRKRGDTPSP